MALPSPANAFAVRRRQLWVGLGVTVCLLGVAARLGRSSADLVIALALLLAVAVLARVMVRAVRCPACERRLNSLEMLLGRLRTCPRCRALLVDPAVQR